MRTPGIPCALPVRNSPLADRQAHRQRARDRLVRRLHPRRDQDAAGHNARFDGLFEIPSFEEVLKLVLLMNERRARDALMLGRLRPRPIGQSPETKHPSYFRDLGLLL
ncbi:MAG: hypothetical protein ACREWE_06915 [Gammaproteobacteria bacterium]